MSSACAGWLNRCNQVNKQDASINQKRAFQMTQLETLLARVDSLKAQWDAAREIICASANTVQDNTKPVFFKTMTVLR
jgi:septal ring factor EnvC (AmiA/AmiB activator)